MVRSRKAHSIDGRVDPCGSPTYTPATRFQKPGATPTRHTPTSAPSNASPHRLSRRLIDPMSPTNTLPRLESMHPSGKHPPRKKTQGHPAGFYPVPRAKRTRGAGGNLTKFIQIQSLPNPESLPQRTRSGKLYSIHSSTLLHHSMGHRPHDPRQRPFFLIHYAHDPEHPVHGQAIATRHCTKPLNPND